MRCTLYGFITDYVKDIFIEDILFHILEKLKEVTEGKTHCTKGKKEKKNRRAEFEDKKCYRGERSRFRLL